jgi:hypothetical protein
VNQSGSPQIHDFNPGILENGLFWVVKIPDSSVSVNVGAGRARMRVTDLEVEDYGDLCNALLDGPSVDADVSFDVVWSDPTGRSQLRNDAPDQQFTASLLTTNATVEWSAEIRGFRFESDPANTSTVVYAEVGEERNGVFFS